MRTPLQSTPTLPVRTAVSAVPTDGDLVMLLRRGPDAVNSAGEWTFPGGKLDAGESLADGAARELFEEARVKSAVRSLGAITEDLHWGPALHFVTHYFEAPCSVDEAEIAEPHKHDGLAWITRADLDEAVAHPSADFPIFPPTARFIADGGLGLLSPVQPC